MIIIIFYVITVVIPASEPYYHPGSVPRAVTSLGVGASSYSTVHWKSYFIRKLEPGVMYEAEVAAKNKYGWAQKSDIFQFNTRSTGTGLSLMYIPLFPISYTC